MATIYFDITSGNDTTGNGDYSTPYQTLNKVRTVMSSGDTIILKDGHHYISADQHCNGLPSCTLRSESDDPSKCIIEGTGTNAYYYVIILNSSATLYASGITFRNLNTDSAANTIYGSPGGWCGIFTYSGMGWFTGPINNHTFVSNCVFDNIQLTGDGNNTGIFVIEYTGSNSTLDVRNCVFRNIWGGVAQIANHSDPSQTSGVFNFINNVVYINGASSYYRILNVTTNIPNSKVNNNVFVNTSGTNTNMFYNSANYPDEFNNNCIYTPSGTITVYPTGTDNITSNPLFVDPANTNFNLRPGSPCIGTGAII